METLQEAAEPPAEIYIKLQKLYRHLRKFETLQETTKTLHEDTKPLKYLPTVETPT